MAETPGIEDALREAARETTISPEIRARMDADRVAAEAAMPFWLAETTIGGRPVWWPMDPRAQAFVVDAADAQQFTSREACEAFIRERLTGEWVATEHEWSV